MNFHLHHANTLVTVERRLLYDDKAIEQNLLDTVDDTVAVLADCRVIEDTSLIVAVEDVADHFLLDKLNGDGEKKRS